MGRTSGDCHDVFMRRFCSLAVLVIGLLVGATACGGEDDSVTAPPTSTNVTESFTNILTLNGARIHTFTVSAPGGITALLTSLIPNNPVGLSLGTWNGSICQIVLDNPSAVQGSVVVGQTTTTGTFCARIYDAIGSLVEPETYVLEVSYQVSNQ
jgi:hypothetical protein